MSYLLHLLLAPILADADGQNSHGLSPLVMVVLLTPVVLPPVLVAWAFCQPAWRGLQLVQGVVLLGFFWLLNGVGLSLLDDFGLAGLLPFLRALLPLALLLNGLTQARQAARTGAYLSWVGLAVTGAVGLLLSPAQAWLDLAFDGQAPPLLLEIGQILLTFALNAAAWWLVLRLLQSRHDQRAVLWRPWWRMPTVAVAVQVGWGVVESSLFVLSSLSAEGGFSRVALPWGNILASMLVSMSLRWITGVIVARLTANKAATSAVAPM